MAKKVIVPGLVAGILMLVVALALGWVYNAIFPGLQNEYTNPNLFRSWSDPLVSWYFVHPFLVGLLLAWIWNKTKVLFATTLTPLQQAVRFASIYWVFSVCGMIMTYSSFPVSLLMVGTWTASILFEGLAASFLLAKLNR
jgi:hypothetical protein